MGKTWMLWLAAAALSVGCVSKAKYAELKEDCADERARHVRLQGDMEERNDKIVAALKKRVKKGDVQIKLINDRMTIRVANRLFFDSGKAGLKPGSEALLMEMAEALKSVKDRQIRVEGHTDNVPIGESLKSRYASNWELSAARAVYVARFLSEKGGLNPRRLSAAGYGPHRPVAANDTRIGRSQNRRIDIVLVHQPARY